MRSIRHAIIVGALSVPLVFGASASAFADTGSSGQESTTTQGNLNIAPVTQVNPAINIAGLFDGFGASNRDYRGGLSGLSGGGAITSTSGITQVNSITSANNQNNTNSTKQSQTGVQRLGQYNATRQGNLNIAPVIQIDVAGLTDFEHTNSTSWGHRSSVSQPAIIGTSKIEQNNTITSTNNQSNILSVHQSAESQHENYDSRDWHGQDNHSRDLLGGLLGSLLN